MLDEDAINEAKNALLHYYSSQQASHGALVIGFTVASFTLIQVFQSSSGRAVASPLMILFFGLGLQVLMLLLIYTIFRFSLYGSVSSTLLSVETEDIEEPTLGKIQEKTFKNLENIKILGIFHPAYFYSRAGAPKKGIFLSFLLAFLPNAPLLFLVTGIELFLVLLVIPIFVILLLIADQIILRINASFKS